MFILSCKSAKTKLLNIYSALCYSRLHSYRNINSEDSPNSYASYQYVYKRSTLRSHPICILASSPNPHESSLDGELREGR